MSFRNPNGSYIRPGYDPLEVANPPTGASATAGNAIASVSFTAPTNTGGSSITNYYAVSDPGQITSSSVTSPISVTGLTNGTSYTFKVWAANSYGPSAYSAPTGAVTPSPPYIEDVFSTYLYSGNSSTQSINNGINLSASGGMVWIKVRTAAANHYLFDTVRGSLKSISSNTTGAQTTSVDSLTAFNTNGFSLGAAAIDVNDSGSTYASWTFRKAEKFFDVVTFTSDGSGGGTFNHNLGSTPGCVIIKSSSDANSWLVYHRSTGVSKYLELNSTSAEQTGTNWISVSSTSVTVGSGWLGANRSMVAYLFAHDAGGFGLSGTDNVISCGSYTGNGSATGPTITLGYEPQWLLVKRASNVAQWYLIDNMRGMALTGNGNSLYPNTSQYENQYWLANFININSTGFQVVNSDTEINANGDTYIYIAIRRGPMKTPTSGSQVYSTVTYSGNGTAGRYVSGAGFAPDFVQGRDRDRANAWSQYDRLRGANARITSTSGAAETTSAGVSGFDQMDGVVLGSSWMNTNGYLDFYNAFKRAPGFMDVVCYSGSNSNLTVNHNLGVIPELIIVKSRNQADTDWTVLSNLEASTMRYSRLNTNAAASSAISYNIAYLVSRPTSTQMELKGGSDVNASGYTFVSYLFATVAGVSKVGSYTGTGTTLQVNCGFSSGSRFVMIKRLDDTGDWYVWDSSRGIVAGNDPYLLLNSTASEVTNTDYVDTFSSGFEISSTAPAAINANGGTYLFLAIA